jgi:hypothetical protein
MTDRIIAILSIIGLVVFTCVLIGFVRELDLSVIIILCLIIAIHDFWATFRDQNNNANQNGG